VNTDQRGTDASNPGTRGTVTAPFEPAAAAGGADAASAAARFGFWVAIVTAAMTVITFALAITALPNKVEYPFTSEEIVAQWPGDYYWMWPAMVLMVLFVALVGTLHELVPARRRVFSRLAFGLAVIAAAVLLIDYYIQATVMQLNLEKGQLDGWSILTQYNPNGVFIALEELGYLLMSVVSSASSRSSPDAPGSTVPSVGCCWPASPSPRSRWSWSPSGWASTAATCSRSS
jgi:hypothetical protein